ncbi:unnamed protein product [Rotaria sp. Silwood2]|nr:unnamed protein product [Rotaria sp. Silwood2]CAF2809317.1 unnamed protein product [Rotaria sp. Silwood2]CAF4056293.1 unnamed protein product [Rotaria sp. Silwood2]CAF4107407.1 unnamed protein product [Rotaria sp. Silwood2]CAF4145878.1 unnamed protein product [Rotaria sp. Silwood2]
MYAYIELSNIARTDAIIRSLSWMSYIPNSSSSLNNSGDNNNDRPISLSSLTNFYEGWLATGNTNHIVSVTYTSIKSDENSLIPDRTNFNLRAHRTDIRLVSWNIPYQKLATIDEKGVIFVWVKHDNRWSLELINDRSHPVTDMSWSHDGRMTIICYEDGFILAGSVTGQRYWSTVLNISQAKVSAVTWMPDVSHVILGTTSGQLIVMDHHGNTTEVLSLSTQSIRQLIYSCNKFYPEAPDNNATKFINDDYILACSLENGQVLFLNNYQDQSPISVDTDLQNIKMDWSSSSEILAVGGHKRVNDINYLNQIIFYTRRGEFLHRTHLPPTTQPLSALCWAHGNDIVFAACGSYVYTIWIIHKSLPSMLTLCQMKIKQNLLNNSLQNLDKLYLPNNLKQTLLNLFRSTIKGFLPDPKNVRSFVCNPLKSHLRLQCTMKRIDNETENVSPTRTTNNLSGAIYVLYLEYLGGLIPLLTAKRISKICPDFIIFDPQIKTNDLSLDSSSSSSSSKLNSSKLSTKKKFLSLRRYSNKLNNISNIQQSKFINNNNDNNNNNNRTSLIGNRNSIYVAETNVHHGNENIITTKSSSGCSSENDSDDENDENMSDLQEKQSRRKTTVKNNKLCTIAANIWGTRFKFYGHSNHLPEVLGSVTYKTSFLHLQPRQMTVRVANNDNIRKQRQQSNTKIKSKKIINPPSRKTKQLKRNKIDEIIDNETKHSSNIPIAPMSPQLSNIRSSLLLYQQPLSSSIHESRHSSQIKTKNTSQRSSRRLQRTSIATTIIHQRKTNIDSSAANSSSTSPINLSRSTSPAASVANFIRPISPPYIQVKQPISPKFCRTSSTTITNSQTYYRHCSPQTTVSSMTNNVDASTASATTTLLIDDSSGYDSNENPNNRTMINAVSNVPESCFEPETYRNLYPFNSNQQKKISLSDPTLNQTKKRSQQQQQQIILNSTTTNQYFSVSSLQQQTSKEDEYIHTDDDNDDDVDDDDEIKNLSSYEQTSSKNKVTTANESRKKYASPRHRMMTCTSGIHDSLTKLSPSSDIDQLGNQSNTSFYVMQNRPPLWNEQSQVYQLDFGGRVTLESAKNFQIEFKGKQVIQFGRIENNCYTLDFEWPFSPLQAFAVALANITQRLK